MNRYYRPLHSASYNRLYWNLGRNIEVIPDQSDLEWTGRHRLSFCSSCEELGYVPASEYGTWILTFGEDETGIDWTVGWCLLYLSVRWLVESEADTGWRSSCRWDLRGFSRWRGPSQPKWQSLQDHRSQRVSYDTFASWRRHVVEQWRWLSWWFPFESCSILGLENVIKNREKSHQ